MAAASETVDTQAFVTLATNDTYALGALVWAHSLRQVGTTRKLAIMITQGVTQGMRSQMSEVFDHITEVNILDSRDSANLALLTRPDLGVTFTKLHCWRLTQYTKCVFMDADTLVLQNIDELFDREELSAAPDAGWPDCFNSGVFVFDPSEETYQALLQFAVTCGSFDGGDQGLLNMFFKDWATKDIQKHLPFIYNVVSQAFYSYLPAFRQFGKNVKVAHFIGAVKPWHHSFNTATGKVEPQAETLHHGGYLQFWWSLFMDRVQPKLDPSVSHQQQKHLVQLYHTLPEPPAHATYCQPKEEINYNQMESPYEPPHVETFYEVQTHASSSSPTKESSPTIIESQDNRQFDFLETFYCEPPMAPEDFYPAPSGAYEAKTFHETWREFATPKEEEAPKESEPEPEDQQEPVIPSQSQRDHISIDGQDSVSDQAHASQDAPVAPQDSQGGSTDYDENSNDIRQDKVTDQDDSSQTNISSWDPVKDKEDSGPEVEKSEQYEMGLVGGLASLKIASGGEYSQQQLDDRQRQYNWEHGQIDYLGIDAFAHIQRKLDQTITKPKGPEKPAVAAEAAKQTKPGKS